MAFSRAFILKADIVLFGKYMKLLEKQYRWLNVNNKKIYNNSKKLYNKYVSNRLTKNIKDRCCNYPLLEEKCMEYNKSKMLQEV